MQGSDRIITAKEITDTERSPRARGNELGSKGPHTHTAGSCARWYLDNGVHQPRQAGCGIGDMVDCFQFPKDIKLYLSVLFYSPLYSVRQKVPDFGASAA